MTKKTYADREFFGRVPWRARFTRDLEKTPTALCGLFFPTTGAAATGAVWTAATVTGAFAGGFAGAAAGVNSFMPVEGRSVACAIPRRVVGCCERFRRV